ncbi:16571_t:CDS:2, partial [Entrophospora sp. SA101]
MSSASKQKRMAKKAAKNATTSVNNASASENKSNSTSSIKNQTDQDTPDSIAAAVNGLSLESMKNATERTATGVLTSQPMSRDVKIEQYTLSFYGRVLIENATIELNFGRRYGLIGSNGSGK